MNDSIVRKTTGELSPTQKAALRRMLEEAFDGELTPEDWRHACGGVHFVLHEGTAPVSHVAVVPRALLVGDRALSGGYVEAVATTLEHRGEGMATRLMRAANELIRADYELGALSTGLWPFYERLGWERWRGPTFVRSGDSWLRTPEEDDGIMILRTPSTSALDMADRICCEDRPGDAW